MPKIKQWTMLLGRFQCIPPHEGHCELVHTLLREGKNVIIGLREADRSEANPFTYNKRKEAFEKIFEEQIQEGRIIILNLPDINEVAYGRKPGWNIREIKLSDDLENISSTEKRKEE